MESTLRQSVRIVLAIIGFAVAMAVRDELSSVVARALVAGVAAVFISIAFSHAQRRSERQ
jgi:hypothetical protein